MSKINGHRPRSMAPRSISHAQSDWCPLSAPNGDQYLGAALAVVAHYHAAHDDLKLSVFESLSTGFAPDGMPSTPTVGVIIATNDPEWVKKLLKFIKPAEDEIKESLNKQGDGTGTGSDKAKVN